MIATRVQFIAEIPRADCPTCGRHRREALLINQYGLVLARRSVCPSCGHRHRMNTHPEFATIAG